MNNYRFYIFAIVGLISIPLLSACSDNDDNDINLGTLTPTEDVFGKATGNFSAEEWFPVDN